MILHQLIQGFTCAFNCSDLVQTNMLELDLHMNPRRVRSIDGFKPSYHVINDIPFLFVKTTCLTGEPRSVAGFLHPKPHLAAFSPATPCFVPGHIMFRATEACRAPFVEPFCYGTREDEWVVAHCGPIKVHLFTREMREQYQLLGWGWLSPITRMSWEILGNHRYIS